MLPPDRSPPSRPSAVEGRNERGTEGADHVSAREAVALLGVRLPTLYAYVSRGLVASIPGPKRKQRLYRLADLERLKARHDARAGHAAVAAGALRWGEPVLDSAITRIDPDGAHYRGVCAVGLAKEDAAFEAVAELLWRGSLPQGAGRPWAAPGFGAPAAELAAALSDGGSEADPLLRLAVALPALAGRDPHRTQPSPDAECARARVLMVRLRAALALGHAARLRRALEAPSMAAGVLVALGGRADAESVRAINRCLVLCADHELNASTFAARVAASAGCDLYACVSAALAVLTGARHGGMSRVVEAMVADVGSPEGARRFVEERCRRGELIPGFGHRLYPDRDPRAEALLGFARGPLGPDSRRDTLLALVDAVRTVGREPPTLDVGLVATTRALRLPAGSAAALFAMGRIAGWIAHVLEQREAGYLLRPRARYIGP
jgi:citrate synthase